MVADTCSDISSCTGLEISPCCVYVDWSRDVSFEFSDRESVIPKALPLQD